MSNIDSNIDEQLELCISPKTRKSFFLFAGAGSGKTHSLVILLNKIREKWEKQFVAERRHVAVITYTNAATNEILNRLDYSPLFHISTIHSFVWDVIKPYQVDIKHLYCINKQKEIDELIAKQEKAKNKATKTYLTNEEKLQKNREQIEKAKTIKRFIYSPNGNNLEYNSLSHADVIKISAQMIKENTLLQKIIAQQYPFLLIDESQDTKEDLVDAFFKIQERFSDIFILGLLGDQKQRIYTDGKENIIGIIPQTWCKPIKHMNYRCGKRIVQLANKIGLSIDKYAEQQPRADAPNGYARLFLVKLNDSIIKDEIENSVMEQMGNITYDDDWKKTNQDVKILCLEHLMAARKLGFAPLFDTFSKVGKYSMTLLKEH